MDLFLLCMLCLICLEFVFSPFTLYCKPFCLNQYLPHLLSKVLVLWHSQILKLLLTLMYVNNTVYFAGLNSDYPFTAYFDFCIWSLHAWGISHFLTLFFSACVLLFSEFLKHACKGLFCWLHWALFPDFGRVAYTVPPDELPLPEQPLRNKLSRTPLLPYSCLLIVLKTGICRITSNICSNRAVRFNLR